jgi:hypothetical protein
MRGQAAELNRFGRIRTRCVAQPRLIHDNIEKEPAGILEETGNEASHESFEVYRKCSVGRGWSNHTTTDAGEFRDLAPGGAAAPHRGSRGPSAAPSSRGGSPIAGGA